MTTKFYYTIESDYITKLGLQGCELLVFSLIASCTRTGSTWRGTTSTMAFMTGYSKRSIERSLISLQKASLIVYDNSMALKMSQFALDMCDVKMSRDDVKMSRDDVKMSPDLRKEPKEENTNTDNNSNYEYISDEELAEIMKVFE